MNLYPLKQNREKGITIVETLIYIFIFSLVLMVIMQNVLSIVRTHRVVKLKQALESSGVIGMERILRETRNASSVNIAQSVLGASPGKLTLVGVNELGLSYTIVFDLSLGALRISKDGGTPGALTEPGILVESLIFRHIATSTSNGVRVEMLLSGSASGDTKNMDLFGFAVLRNSY